MRASDLIFINIGINNLLKKKFEINIIFSDSATFGNFLTTKSEIILQKHFIEYGNE